MSPSGRGSESPLGPNARSTGDNEAPGGGDSCGEPDWPASRAVTAGYEPQFLGLSVTWLVGPQGAGRKKIGAYAARRP